MIRFFTIAAIFFNSAAHSADAPSCSDTDKVYKECANQEELYSAALSKAKADKKKLVVVIGAEWCPWCISLHKMLLDPSVITPELQKEYSFVDIAIYPAKDSKKKLPSGVAVQELLAKKAGFKGKFGGIPVLAVVNAQTGKAELINTEPLEKNTETSKGHDPAKLLAALKEAGPKVK